MKSLVHLAFKSQNTFGRSMSADCDRDHNLYFMDPFILDLVKIQYSKAFRRLKGKTQVVSGAGNVNIALPGMRFTGRTEGNVSEVYVQYI